ncbi:MAG: hypothetical protein JKX94_10025, partial [Sneathiella sp.]|nr:hypothetical protein [Sneathiella sp.]
TFIAYIGRQFPELNLDLPPTAIGKDYLVGGRLIGDPVSGHGVQFSLLGYGGFAFSQIQGIEFHFLGLTTGYDFDDKALKFPGIGRVSLK